MVADNFVLCYVLLCCFVIVAHLFSPKLSLPGFSRQPVDDEATYTDAASIVSTSRPSGRPSLALFTDDMNDADLAASYEV